MTDFDQSDELKARAVWFMRHVEGMTYTAIMELTELDYVEISDLEALGAYIRIMDKYRVQNCGRIIAR